MCFLWLSRRKQFVPVMEIPCSEELSINLLLTIESVRSLKIEDIHSRSLEFRARASKIPCRVLQWIRREKSEGRWLLSKIWPVNGLNGGTRSHTPAFRHVKSVARRHRRYHWAARVRLSYATTDVDGNQWPHSIIWPTEVYSFPSANVTVAFPSFKRTRHGIAHSPPKQMLQHSTIRTVLQEVGIIKKIIILRCVAMSLWLKYELHQSTPGFTCLFVRDTNLRVYIRISGRIKNTVATQAQTVNHVQTINVSTLKPEKFFNQCQ